MFFHLANTAIARAASAATLRAYSLPAASAAAVASCARPWQIEIREGVCVGTMQPSKPAFTLGRSDRQPGALT